MPDQTPVVTRFAPSPTGFLHIGGARPVGVLDAQQEAAAVMARARRPRRRRRSSPG